MVTMMGIGKDKRTRCLARTQLLQTLVMENMKPKMRNKLIKQGSRTVINRVSRICRKSCSKEMSRKVSLLTSEI